MNNEQMIIAALQNLLDAVQEIRAGTHYSCFISNAEKADEHIKDAQINISELLFRNYE